MAKPAAAERPRIRFLTSVDYPPFNFLDARGHLGGFNVDLVRLVCDEMGLIDRCQIEARPFAELLPALMKGEADAVVAGIAVTPANRDALDFTQPYFRYPARFVTLKSAPLAEPLGVMVAGKTIGVVDGSAHDAMLQAWFPTAVPVAFKTRELALEALRKGGVAAVFGDGVGLSFWLQSDDAKDCCAFSGGPFLSERFLGEGLAIAVRKPDADLARAFDYAIGQVVARRQFSELLLRYFPVSVF